MQRHGLRVGLGHDTHRLGPGAALVLGGVAVGALVPAVLLVAGPVLGRTTVGALVPALVVPVAGVLHHARFSGFRAGGGYGTPAPRLV